jgi:HPt (histidine-containing phosphotransfer) domain-containing protein
MDAYVSKPIRGGELAEVIDGLLAPQANPKHAAQALPAEAGDVFDRNTALAVANGDEQFLMRMVRMFRDQSRKLVGEIQEAIQRGDTAAVQRIAHTLKAVVGSFGAQKAGRAAAQLEDEANKGTLTGCETAFVTLNETIASLQQALDNQFKEMA